MRFRGSHQSPLAVAIFLAAVAATTARASTGERTGEVQGTVVDTTGSTIAGARVSLLTATSTEIRSTLTSDAGSFWFGPVDPAAYILAIARPGFQEVRKPVVVREGEAIHLSVTLDIGGIVESVTVTASRGIAEETIASPQFTTVMASDDMRRRTFSIFPQALSEEPGVHVQQTSTSQGSPFIRGLTGQQVVALVDGVRFNNATFRPGANQYTALIDPGVVDRVEIVRGPSAAQYGSDSLGGAINVLTAPGWGGADGARADGLVEIVAASADVSAGFNGWLGLSRPSWGLLAGGGGRRSQDLRTGGGIDSHSVATRLLGLPSDVLGDRLQSTGYSQYAVHVKGLAHPSTADAVTVHYVRSGQAGASRYDQLNGGVGNLLNRFDPQALDFFTARYDRVGAAWFDTVSSTFSVNRQRDDRTYQSVNNTKLGLRSPVSGERNETTVLGYQGQAARRIHDRYSVVVGGEFYRDGVRSTRRDLSYNASTDGFTDATAGRGRYPNGAVYRSLGLFAQSTMPITAALSGTFAGRWSRFAYEQKAADNLSTSTGPVVPDYATALGDSTFNAGIVYAPTERVVFAANVSRGFRAPNVNDFGSIGLSGLGFEVSADEAMRVGANLAALSGTGEPNPRLASPAHPLAPERAFDYEAGVRTHLPRLTASAVWFDSEISGLIERRTVLMSPGAVGQTIGGQEIIRQDQYGAVYTAMSSSAVFARANAGRVRLRGGEATVTWRMGKTVTLDANVAAVRGTDLATGLAPNLENGIPPVHGFGGIRWQPSARWWVEGYSLFAASQHRFSSNDLEQARIGGIRTQAEIANFFNNGAVARGLVRGGLLVATGETVSQVVARVLGADTTARVPFMTFNPAFATANVRGGVQLPGRGSLTVIAENLLDENYRLMGSGIDGAGFNLTARFALRF